MQNFHLSGLWVDVDLRRLNTVVVGAGLVAEAGAVGQHGVGVEAARADDRRAVVAEQPRARDIGYRQRFSLRALDENFTIARYEISGVGFQHFRGLLEQLLLDVGRGVLDRIAAHVGEAAGKSA